MKSSAAKSKTRGCFEMESPSCQRILETYSDYNSWFDSGLRNTNGGCAYWAAFEAYWPRRRSCN